MHSEFKHFNYYRLSPDEVLRQLGITAKGLSAADAKERFERTGGNELVRSKHENPLLTLIRQFKNLLVVMLILSAGFSIYLKDAKTATILILIALMNAGVGFFQEYKAESLLKNLEKLVVPKAKVWREGKLEEIDSTELVVGDIVYVEEGDSVPADVRLLGEAELSTNDFALTGESNPSRKFVHAISADVPLGDRHNLMFMGTTVATGSGHGVVIGTGMQTELGRIAGLSQATKAEVSPLQKEMNHLATRIAQGTVILAVFLTAIAFKSNIGLHSAILFGIGIGAAMIPNGLVAEVNITLAQAASRLAKARALVKKLSAVETLGATNFILTDKTGTLTKNEMTVTQILIGRKLYNVFGTGYEANGKICDDKNKKLSEKQLKEIELFFTTAAMASNAKVDPPDNEHSGWYVVGDPTEGALITLVRKAGLEPEQLQAEMPELKEFQFDSARKLLSSVRKRNGQVVVFSKGAPESILKRSTDVWDHGHIRKLSQKDRQFFSSFNETEAKAAKRNLAFGFRVLSKRQAQEKFMMEDIEKDFTFLGMVSMVDPLREDVPESMSAAREAHIRVSIVTGDYPTTAKAIAQQAGLNDDITIVVGEELEKLSDSRVLELVSKGGAVFSRVSPEDKLRIVSLVKNSGHVVAVTGDGINDAPALKRADIGVAMGKTGTDVAKDAAEIVLLDDSFNTLVGAVEQGRLTFQNIKKAARCALTDNAGELFTVLISLAALSIFHVAPAITAIQILAIDVVAQILPITALGWDSAQNDLMHGWPRNPRDHIISLPSIAGFIIYGLLASVLSYSNYLLFLVRHHLSLSRINQSLAIYHQATTLTYVTLVLCLYVYLMFERNNDDHFFTGYLWSNKKLLIAFLLSFFLIGNIVYNPWIQPYFSSGPLRLIDWATAFSCALIYACIRLSLRAVNKRRVRVFRASLAFPA
jgi:P-type Ca2+ transporter type 2C